MSQLRRYVGQVRSRRKHMTRPTMTDIMRSSSTDFRSILDLVPEYLGIFWDEAAAMDPSARDLDEGARFPMCNQGALQSVFQAAGLQDIKSSAIEITIPFETFSDYWQPFLGGTGPAPLYIASLNAERRAELSNRLENQLAIGEKGAITLAARAWAIRGKSP